MIREYPPILRGDAERQAAQLREYLVRLVRYLDEELSKESATVESTPDARVDTLATQMSRMPQILYGEAAAGGVVFDRPFAKAPVVFVTTGSASDVTSAGFEASADTQWIAVGR